MRFHVGTVSKHITHNSSINTGAKALEIQSPELFQWLAETVEGRWDAELTLEYTEYDTGWETYYLYLDFDTERDAVLFKMTWL